FVAGDTNEEVGKEAEKAGKLPYEKQLGGEALHLETTWEKNDQKVYEGSAEKKEAKVAFGRMPGQARRGRDGNKVKLLIALVILLLLTTAVYFLKFYSTKPVFVHDKQVTPRPQSTLTQENTGHPDVLSEPPETRSSLTAEPKKSVKTIGHKSRRKQPGKEKHQSGKKEATVEGRMITSPGRTGGTPSPKFRKRSFTPPSREDL
ncbi:MAG: hypothetical protein P8013_15410, partial [Candidatus Sulfobium sp.]